MRYCPKCLVGLEDRTERCPLCGSAPVAQLPGSDERQRALEALGGKEPFAPEVRNADLGEKLQPEQLRKLLVELSAVSLGMVLVVTLVIDFLATRSLTWSLHTSIVLAFIWLAFSMPLVLWKRPWLVYSVLGPAALLAVFLWFLVPGRLDLFLALALPITVLIEALAIGSGVLVAIERPKGLNAAGTVLAAIAILCIGIELCVSRYATGSFACSWSAIVAIAALPVGGLFFYLHYRVVNHASLRKIFRL